MTEFESVANTSTLDDCLEDFKEVLAQFDNFVGYAKNTWFIPHKERFVSDWIDRVMHPENTTTNKIESTHWQLKRLMSDSEGDSDLCNPYDVTNNMITLQNKI